MNFLSHLVKWLLIPTLPKLFTVLDTTPAAKWAPRGLQGGSEEGPADGAATIGWWLSLPGASGVIRPSSGRPDAPCTGANGACSWTGSLLRPVSAGRTLGSLRSSFQEPRDTGAPEGCPSGSSDGQSVQGAPAVPCPRCSLLHVALSPALRLRADSPLSRDPQAAGTHRSQRQGA